MTQKHQTIYCANLEEFVNMLYALAIKGLTFEAHADRLMIELTGGY